jgi:HSP20 family protein
MNALVTQHEDRAVRENQPAEPHYMTPLVDIFETKDGYVLLAEMPGVVKEGLEVTLEGNTLTLAGHRTVDWPKAEVIFRESRPVHFRRVFELDPAIDAGKINARVEQGVLTLELPKAEQVKPRKISVG